MYKYKSIYKAFCGIFNLFYYVYSKFYLIVKYWLSKFGQFNLKLAMIHKTCNACKPEQIELELSNSYLV